MFPDSQDQHSQQMLCAMIEGMQTGVMIFDDAQVIYANPEFGRMLGYESNEILHGTPVVDLVTEPVPATQGKKKKPRAQRQLKAGKVWLKSAAGEPVQMTLNLSRVFWDGQPHFIASVSPTSEEDLLEIEARKNRAAYERPLIAELERQQANIARELHDSLGSELAGLSLMVGGLKAFRPGDLELSHRLDEVLAQLQTAIEMTRGLAHGLMPVHAGAGGFWRALERLASDWTLLKGVPCEFEMHGDFDTVSAQTGTHLYRIAQEAITNALRHGGASLIQLRLSESPAGLVLDIEDNGKGMSDDLPGALPGKGMGMRSMVARAASIGGELEFSAVKPTGSRVRVVWPATLHSA